METNPPTQKFLSSPRWLAILLPTLLFIFALGIRLFDLTDPPNDFYLVRQYRSMLIARSMYYQHLASAPAWQREVAIAQRQGESLIEPPIMETLAALTYRLTGEQWWVGRIYASLFWVLGGLAILLLAREMAFYEGGLVALAFYLFVHFGIIAGRAIQPDPLMVCLTAWALFALYRWEVRRTWSMTVWAGVLTGLAILIKSVAVFPLFGAAAGLVLARGAFKRTLQEKQVWCVAALTAIPTILFYIYGIFIVGTLGGQFALRFFPAMLLDPSFYARWIEIAISIVELWPLLITLLGVFLFRTRVQRGMAIGIWLGYVVYGLTFPYYFTTHDYYHLPLILIVSIGLLPAADLLLHQLAVQSKSWVWRLGFIGILFLGVGIKMWDARVALVRVDYRHEIAYWQQLGDEIGHSTKVIELSGDYGVRLAYFGWIDNSEWPQLQDTRLRQLAGTSQPDFATTFAEETAGKDVFVVTSLSEWDNQKDLKQYVTTHYPLSGEGDGYLIFDLRHPLPAP
jgi:4-amino-4-deoxy-L-arabinose transferase-like glycosyltransferase